MEDLAAKMRMKRAGLTTEPPKPLPNSARDRRLAELPPGQETPIVDLEVRGRMRLVWRTGGPINEDETRSMLSDAAEKHGLRGRPREHGELLLTGHDPVTGAHTTDIASIETGCWEFHNAVLGNAEKRLRSFHEGILRKLATQWGIKISIRSRR